MNEEENINLSNTENFDSELEKLFNIAQKGEIYFSDDELMPFNFQQYEHYQMKNQSIFENNNENNEKQTISFWIDEPFLDSHKNLSKLNLEQNISSLLIFLQSKGVEIKIISLTNHEIYQNLKNQIESTFCFEDDLKKMILIL